MPELQGCAVLDHLEQGGWRIPDSVSSLPEVRLIVPQCREGREHSQKNLDVFCTERASLDIKILFDLVFGHRVNR